MKKLFSIFLTVLLFVSAFTTTCFAENTVQLKLNSETDTVYAGDEFIVRLVISDNSKMSGAAIDINYDKNKLEYVSGSFGGILDDSATKSLKNIKSDAPKVRFTYLSPSSAVTSQGVLVVLKFKALENASGTTELSITIPNPGDFISQDLTRLSYTVVNANVKILNLITETQSEYESESESVTEEITESQKIETIGPIETTTKPVKNVDDDEGFDTVIILALALGFAFIFIVVLLSRKPNKKKSNSKKKKRKK